MRIANQTVVRNYTRNLNSNAALLDKYSNMVSSQRRFTSMAEEPSMGVRAMQIRRSMANIESYTDTAKTVNSQFQSAEDQMMKIVSLGQDIATRYTNALNGTNAEDDMDTFVKEVTQLRDQILSCANGQFSERFMFGGTNTTTQPFTLDPATQELMYNGISVKDMAGPDGKLKDEYKYLQNDAGFVDIGLGLKNENGTLVETTAFKSTLNGIDFMGIGDDNLYNICTEIIDALKSPDFNNSGSYAELLNRVRTATNNVTLGVTELGAKTQYLDYTVSRMEDETINLSERQKTVEGIDSADAIMQWKMQEYVYNAALQMGQRLLQPTLFNFIS